MTKLTLPSYADGIRVRGFAGHPKVRARGMLRTDRRRSKKQPEGNRGEAAEQKDTGNEHGASPAKSKRE
jgi:hypothetical protein